MAQQRTFSFGGNCLRFSWLFTALQGRSRGHLLLQKNVLRGLSALFTCRLCRDRRPFQAKRYRLWKRSRERTKRFCECTKLKYQSSCSLNFDTSSPDVAVPGGGHPPSPSTCCDRSWWCLWSASCRWGSRRRTSSWVWGRRCSTDTCVHRRRSPCPRCSRSRWSTRRTTAMETSGTWGGWRGNLGMFLGRHWNKIFYLFQPQKKDGVEKNIQHESYVCLFEACWRRFSMTVETID